MIAVQSLLALKDIDSTTLLLLDEEIGRSFTKSDIVILCLSASPVLGGGYFFN